MVTEVKEVKTEAKATQSLESVLDEGQALTEEGSAETTGETEESEAKSEATKVEKPDPIFEARVRSEVDKSLKTYREKDQTQSTFIKSLVAERAELRAEKKAVSLGKSINDVLGFEEEDGVEPTKLEAHRKGLEDIRTAVLEYDTNSAQVKEVATMATLMAEKINKGFAKDYDLNDSNPAVRARGAIELIAKAVDSERKMEAFKKIIEEIPLLRNGSEVRQQIDGYIEKYLRLSDPEGRDLLIKDARQELQVTPTKRPQRSQDGSGGGELFKGTPEQRIEQALKRENQRRK